MFYVELNCAYIFLL